MYQALLNEYREIKKEVLGKLKPIEWVLTVALSASIVFFVISNFFRNIYLIIASLIVMLIFTTIFGLYVAVVAAKDKKNKFELQNERLNKLENLLKSAEVSCYDDKHVKLFISMAKEYESEPKIGYGKQIMFFFSSILCPIIAMVAGTIAKMVSEKQLLMILLSVFGISIVFFIAFFLLYPEIKAFINRNIKLSKELREDLEMILISLES